LLSHLIVLVSKAKKSFSIQDIAEADAKSEIEENWKWLEEGLMLTLGVCKMQFCNFTKS
jgi:hypothetical protein